MTPSNRPALVQPRELEGRLVLFVDGLDFDLGGVRQERAHDHAGAVGQRVHAQQLVRRLVDQPSQTAEFVFRQQHDGNDSEPR